MKKILLLLVFGLTLNLSNAQSYVIQGFSDTVYVNGDNSDFEIVQHFVVENTGNVPVDILVLRTKNTVSGNWSGSYICADVCWPDHVDTVPFTVPVGGSQDLDIHFMSDMAIGNGEVVIEVSEKSSSVKQKITVIASAYPLFVPKLNESTLKFYPNPVSEALNVELSGVENGAVVEVYNIIGKKLMVFPVFKHGTRFVVPVANLPRGSYVLRVSQDGEVITKKFQKTN